MAPKLEDVAGKMKELVETGGGLGDKERLSTLLGIMAEYLKETVAQDVDNGQCAVLMIVRGGRQLAFAHPPHLVSGNCFPLGKKSIAGRAALSTGAVVQNNMPEEEHHGFYERVPDPDGEVRQIQKMVAAAIPGADGKAIGVIEVSRTGTNRLNAGRDFTDDDGDRLAKLAKIFAPFIQKTWVNVDVL